ncbi:hypothetical protein [Herbiconiux sp. UC225_62]|uniref:hypothetical protein n=1 Tax=Herbiconiux sp. UC225_62 TaxID=3350168 RepID=UPI0036D2E63F
MNTTPRFDQGRSDAIRTMLIENVEQSPSRDHRRHVRIAVLAIVAALAGALGIGGVALAVTGGPIFPAPAGTPVVEASPTPTSTPEATPTSTPGTPVAGPVVTGDPIPPHDIDSASSSGAWQLDLPGSGRQCEIRNAYDIADGFALFQAGPDQMSDAPGPDCDFTATRMSLTLVDTAAGTIVWSREWDAVNPGYPVDVTLLGTSGRALVSTQNLGQGVNEVIDVATGETLAAFAPHLDGAGDLQYSFATVPGDSGEIVLGLQARGPDGAGLVGSGIVERVDPRTLDRPVWSTTLAGTFGQISRSAETPYPATFVPFDYFTGAEGPDLRSHIAIVDVNTGEVTDRPATTYYRYAADYALRFTDSTADRSVVGLDADGNHLWERELPVGTRIDPVLTSDGVPGALANRLRSDAPSEWLMVHSPQSLTLVNALTGVEAWTVATGCGADTELPQFSFRLNEPAATVVLPGSGGAAACSYDLATGSLSEGPAIPENAWEAAGVANVYGVAEGTGSAYDAATGEVLWTIPAASGESWDFLGGHLVSWAGTRLTGIG